MALDDTVQKAFDQALEAVGKPMDDTTPAADSTPEPATAEPAGDDSAATTPEPTPEPAPEPEAKEPDVPAEEQFISDEDFAKLQNDPVAVRKEMQKAFTQKTQRIAEHRKLVEALERDPVNTIRYLAQVAGLNIADPVKEAVPEPLKEVKEKLSTALGEEAAETVLPVFKEFAESIVKAEVEPLRQHQEMENARRAEEETKQVLDGFDKKYPDWRKHEPKMMEIAKNLIPRGMTETQYLERLYILATAEVREADSIKKATARINQSVTAAATSSPDSPASTTKVTPAAQKGKNFDETLELAFRAAVRGERWAS